MDSGQANKPPPTSDKGATFSSDLPTDPSAITNVYQNWSEHYEQDVIQWGYDTPQQAANLLTKHISPHEESVNSILDAGAGDGLMGVALRKAFSPSKIHIIGTDLSQAMLEKAIQRQCYDTTQVVDLYQRPLPFDSNFFDLVTCVGTLTHLDPTTCYVLEEFCRVVKPGGYVCYTHRTDKLHDWKPNEEQLEREKKWEMVQQTEPLAYLPKHPEYGDRIKVVVMLYRVI